MTSGSGVAVAIWVKTPGRSPVKTRLASGIGTDAAEEFYRRSADAVRAAVQTAADQLAGRLTPFWATAEADPDAWPDFATIHQGTGGLGERLSHVYDALRERHDRVVFIGADAPQITPVLIEHAVDLAASGDWIFGPADDGGFYLFAGSRPIPRERWLGVPYSAPNTLRELVRVLEPLAPVIRLAPGFDVDTRDDLLRLRLELAARPDLLPEQRSLSEWLETVVERK